jgi:hypothetical protein
MTTTLVTEVGGTTSNSYITLQEAEGLISAYGINIDRWNSLDETSALRFTTSQAGPYSFTLNVNDKLKLAVGAGSDQTVTLTGQHLNALSVCNQLNDQTVGVDWRPTLDNRISVYTDTHSDSLYIKSITNNAYSILGIAIGTYIQTAITTYKEYLLQLGALMIGHLPLRGRRTTTTQALDFPRFMQDYSDTSDLPESATKIPDVVKTAQALLTCMVIEPNMNMQSIMAGEFDSPSWLQDSSVKQVQVAGIMTVKLGASSDSSSGSGSGSSKSAALVNVYGLPVYLLMKPYLTQIRGGVIRSPEEDYYRITNNIPDYNVGIRYPYGWLRL